MFASVTRLRVRSVKYLPAFLWMTFRSQRQVLRATGFLGGRLLLDAKRTFWTLTVWESERAMKAFRGGGPHARAMPKLVEWCDEAAYVHWSPASTEVPSWLQAYEYLVSDGQLSRVAHPSVDHQARKFPKPRLRPLIGQDVQPTPSNRKPPSGESSAAA